MLDVTTGIEIPGSSSSGAAGSNGSVGSTGAAVPSSATAVGFQNAAGNLVLPTPSAGLPVADSGAAITGASIPAGGVGLTGWLSAIWSNVSTAANQLTANTTLASILSKLSGVLSVSWSGQSVGVGNKPVGPAALATSQASIGTGASLIVAARTGAVGTGRVAVTLYNSGATTVYFGPSGVTTATGAILPAGAAVTLDTTAAVYGVTSSGTDIVGVTETF
jgi:hypothetical protein